MLYRRTLAGIGGLASFAYRAAPAFFRRVSQDMKRAVEPAPRTPRIASWPKRGVHAAWIGHSTVALSIDGFTILTDPVFSTRIGINLGPITLGLKRLVEPAAALGDFPTPDLILLSHAHMDHFDIPTLRRLENRGTAVITATNTSDLLRPDRYGSVRELRWNESARIGPATIRALEVNHWGARMRSDTHRSYNGYLIEAGGYRVLFAGDTAFTDSFRSVRTSKPVDLAIMPIGAYDPWIRVHCNPEQALAMANDAGAEFILPVHHRTFELSREPLHEPLERILAAAGGAADRICIRDFGQEFQLA
ncbi:MAG TPA: MBL fold metallo-hydrolase [Bryobacteraceae bacterium]|nr:MBL fold metallo-hydrolase [Bryobacteraceae bacterium]